MSVKVLKTVAQQVRFWAEDYWRSNGAGDEDLCGCCAIASAKLFNELMKAGLNPILHYMDCHVHVRVENTIVDVTATQFSNGQNSYPEVLIAPVEKMMSDKAWRQSYNPWRSETQFTNIPDLQEFMEKRGWVDEQTIPDFLIQLEMNYNPQGECNV